MMNGAANKTMNIKKTLQKHNITLTSFSELLDISRPTLNSYIKVFESNSKIANEKIQIVFEELFNYDLSNDEFCKRLSKYHDLLQRDKTMGVLELQANVTDLFTSVMNNIKSDFYSNDYDENIYVFINMLISSYKTEKLFMHLVKYFLVLNDIISYHDIDFKKDIYLFHYFSMFEKDKKNYLKYDAELEKKYVNRINEIKEIKKSSDEIAKNRLIDLLNKEIDKINDMGLQLSEEEILNVLLNKIKKGEI